MNQQVAWAIGGQVGRKPILGILALTGEVFLDTNILLYAALGMDDSPEKWAISRQILLEGKFATSGQVLSEFYSNAIRKGRSPISKSEALNWVRQLALKPCQAIDSQLVEQAIGFSDRYQISYWDGAIIAAAHRLGAKIVLTEDLNHNQNYGTVTARNPFLS
jgi:predicted nucleic acid-binding protein